MKYILTTHTDDIEIIFSHGSWEAKAEFAQTDVHRQIAIVFKSPPYQDQDIYEEVEVNVFLRRLSDRMDSEPVKFTYTPPNPGQHGVSANSPIDGLMFECHGVDKLFTDDSEHTETESCLLTPSPGFGGEQL